MTQFSLPLCPRNQESHTNCHPSPNQALTPQEDPAALTSNCTTKDTNTQSPPWRASPSSLGHCGLGRGVGFPIPPAGTAPTCGPFLCVKGSPGPWQMSSGSGCIEIALPQSAPPFIVGPLALSLMPPFVLLQIVFSSRKVGLCLCLKSKLSGPGGCLSTRFPSFPARHQVLVV